LKLIILLWPRPPKEEFPRLFSRGHIEAPSPRVKCLYPVLFPRLFSRGHIEASYWRRNGSYRRGFPRLFSRGHIEAARREKK